MRQNIAKSAREFTLRFNPAINDMKEYTLQH